MPTLTIFDDEYATLWFHTESRVVHHKIHKFMPDGRFRKLLTAGAEQLKKHKAQKWLSDDRGNAVVRQEDANWARAVWTPRVVRHGFKYWAILMPTKAPIWERQMRKLIAEYEQLGVTVQVFSKPDDALKWLESVDKAVAR